MTQPSGLRYLLAFKDLDIPQDAILFLLPLPSHVAQHSKTCCENPLCVLQCQDIPGTLHIPLPTAFLAFEICWKFLSIAYLFFLIWLMHGVCADRHGHACDFYSCKSRIENLKCKSENTDFQTTFLFYLPNSVR